MRAKALEREALVAVADFFAELLLLELDARRLARLRALAPVLEELGIELTLGADLDELAAEYYACFVQPDFGGPPLQSLWTPGGHEGDAAAALRDLARRAGLVLERNAARGAAPDHLGAILALWAATRLSVPEVADELERQHLAWARAPLAQMGRGAGFYASLARAVLGLLALVVPE